MRHFFSYFISKQFLINLLIILAVIALLFFASIKWLASYTNHGEYVVVPDLTGKRTFQLNAEVEGKDVSYEIIDSIYDPAQKPGMVLRQDPEPATRVKHNRTVYLYVTTLVPPQIDMPALIDRSERQAKLIVETYGLKLGKVTLKEADCEGCVLGQEIKGEEIEPGTKVKKGTVVDLVVGTKHRYLLEKAEGAEENE